MKNYTTSSIRDLGDVADLTQGLVGGSTADGVVYTIPLPDPPAGPGGSTTVIGTLSGITSPFPRP